MLAVKLGCAVAVCVAVAVAACGGPPSRRSPSGPSDAPPPDLSSALPPDAAFTATFFPAAWRALTEALGQRAVGLDQAFRKSDAGFTVEAELWPALGIDERAPAWLAVRGGPVPALLELSDDLERVLNAPDAVAAWLNETPMPAAWLHVRLVGTPTTTPPGDATALWLSERFGAIQSVGLDEGSDALAVALESDPHRVAPLHAALVLRGQGRVHRLLEATTPTLVVVSRGPDRVLVDLVQDRGVGPGALAAGLEAALNPSLPADDVLDRVDGPPARGEALRAVVAHRSFARWARAMGDAEVVRAALQSELIPPEARAAQVQRGRRDAGLPERLAATGLDLFRASVIRVRSTDAALLVDVESRYTSRAAPLGQLGRGHAAVPHRLLQSTAAVRLTLATPGAPALQVLDEVAPEASVPLDLHLAEAMRCGFVCWPSLWTALPAYGRKPIESFGAVFPEVTTFAAALAGAQGVSATVVFEPTAGFALAQRPALQTTVARTTAQRAFEGVEHRAVVAPDGPVELLGNDAGQLGALERALSSSDAVARETPLLLELSVAGALSTVFRGADLRLGFEAEAMHLGLVLAWLPLAPTPAP
jgi:hypothetical protein